jgi:hypothetical protein
MIGNLALVILFLILFVWSPASFAAELSATLPSIHMRGPLAIAELFAHGVVTAVCVTAGWALLNRQPHGPALARIALVGSAAVSAQSLYWSVLPSQTPPGSELPLAALAAAHAAVWLVYLHHSSRIRAMTA